MADDKRNRTDQQQGGNQDRDRQRQRDRKPSSGGMESPGSSGSTPRSDEDREQQE
ncbi:MAG TPA: hypothetical protein VF405_14945 [Gammaproteobacteria bacterium]|jgi:hypothetical protein